MYRKEVIDKVGEYDPDMFLVEDYEYWIRISEKFKIGHLNKNLYIYRKHENSLTGTRKKDINRQLYRLRIKHIDYLVSNVNREYKEKLFLEMLSQNIDDYENLLNKFWQKAEDMKKYLWIKMSNKIENNKKIVSAASWSLCAEIVAKLIAPITNMILARLLLPEAFGAVATITMIISFADVFTDAGFQKYIIQHEFDNDDEYNKSIDVAFWSNIVLSVAAVLVIIIFRNKLADWVGSPDLAAGMSVASMSIIISSFSSIQMSVLKRAFDFKTLFIVRVAIAFVPLLVTVPLAFIFRNYWALVLGTLTMNFMQAILLTIKCPWKPQIYYSFSRFKDMFSFSAWTLLESISIWLTSYIGTFIVGRSLNDYYLGLYKTSMTTVNAYMCIITSSISPVLFSALSRYQNDDIRFRRTYYRFQSLVSDIIMPMGVGLYVFRGLATRILLGEKWLEASDFIGWWSLASSLTIACSFANEAYRSKGKPNISLLSQLLHLVVLVPVLSISARGGYHTLTLARSLVRLQLIITNSILLKIFFGFTVLETIRNIYAQMLSAIIMGVVAFYLSRFNPTLVGWQFVVIAISAVLYFGLLLLFPNTRNDVLGILRAAKNKFVFKKV